MSANRELKHQFDAAPWKGRTRRYDIVKEGTIALAIVAALTLVLALLMGSPDESPLTFKGWATTNADNFYATAVQELSGSSGTATYGGPYNSNADGLNVGPFWLQKWAGVTHPIDTVNDFVITPLSTQLMSAEVTSAVSIWNSATQTQQGAWATSYDEAITKVEGKISAVPAGDYGPVPVLASGLTSMAKSGGLDAALLSQGGFFQTDNTKQILFFGDGSYLDDAGTAANLQGGTWGMMNETGRYPGQAWLWLYSFWYQIPPFNNEESAPIGANADAYIMFVMGALSLGLILIPVIPGIRSLPMRIPIHRGIWSQYYKSEGIKRRKK
ncbi:unannotated protein [freshwater metagenome]|uniref:Unannotated protein n=1 Tax=freshwater metagenome TaxID=449393 RepID=A0A6J7H8Q4_9ZZZZ|nr:hypothetical protein [Actinomycetota bacterium]